MNVAEDTARAKSELRLKARAARRALTPEQKAEASSRIALTILALPELRDARSILAYEPLPEELDLDTALHGLRERGVRVALPRVVGPHKVQLHWVEPDDELGVSAFGVREPLAGAPVAPVDAIDAVLAPGVAYDVQGRRLGFGAGFFDALFKEMDDSVIRIGIAYQEQIFRELPDDEHDQAVDMVVTPRHVYRPRGQ